MTYDGHMLDSLTDLVDQVSRAREQGQPPHSIPENAAPECDDCGEPATVISKNYKLCAYCIEEHRSHYGILPSSEGGNWSGRCR